MIPKVCIDRQLTQKRKKKEMMEVAVYDGFDRYEWPLIIHFDRIHIKCVFWRISAIITNLGNRKHNMLVILRMTVIELHQKH